MPKNGFRSFVVAMYITRKNGLLVQAVKIIITKKRQKCARDVGGPICDAFASAAMVHAGVQVGADINTAIFSNGRAEHDSCVLNKNLIFGIQKPVRIAVYSLYKTLNWPGKVTARSYDLGRRRPGGR